NRLVRHVPPLSLPQAGRHRRLQAGRRETPRRGAHGAGSGTDRGRHADRPTLRGPAANADLRSGEHDDQRSLGGTTPARLRDAGARTKSSARYSRGVTATDVETRTDAANTQDAMPDRPWRRAVRAAGALWVISHVGDPGPFRVAFWRSGRAPGLRDALSPWNHWDSTWFVRIATEGYTNQHCDAPGCKAAFFPLYPMLVRAVDVVLPGGALPAALAVSSVT